MSRDQNRTSVVQQGTGSTYQSAGTFSHKAFHFDICHNLEIVSHRRVTRNFSGQGSFLGIRARQ